MLENIRVLDERNIYFKIVDGTLEVYDQNDSLIGESPLPIPIEEDMDVETIYSIAESCGYNIGEMIDTILREAVMEERLYDVWLTNENMIFYSPSAGQFVAEPYEGLFHKLGTYFSNLQNFTSHSVSDEEEMEDEQLNDYENNEFEEEYVENEYNEDEEYMEEEYIENEEDIEDEEEDTEYEVEEISQEDINEEENETFEEDSNDEEFEAAYAKRFSRQNNEESEESQEFEVIEDTEELLSDENEEDVEMEEIIEDNSTEELVPTTNIPENTRVTHPTPEQMKELENRLQEWKKAYISVLHDNRIIDGVSIKEIRDRVVEIILKQNKSVFDISEKEVLFELIDTCPVMFDSKTALQAGFYQAYLLQKEDLIN